MPKLIKIYEEDLINMAIVVYMNARLEAAERITSEVARELLLKTDPMFDEPSLEKLKESLRKNIESFEVDSDGVTRYNHKPEIIELRN